MGLTSSRVPAMVDGWDGVRWEQTELFPITRARAGVLQTDGLKVGFERVRFVCVDEDGWNEGSTSVRKDERMSV